MNTAEVLKKTYIFYTLTDDELAVLSEHAQVVDFPKDSVIFREGDDGGSLYVVKSGKIAVKKSLGEGREANLVDLTQFFFFGEISLFDGGKRSATCIAAEDSVCIVLEKADFWATMLANPLSAHKVYRAILSVHTNAIRRANDRFRKFLGQALDNV